MDAAGGRAAFEKLRNRVMKGSYESAQAGLKGTATFFGAAPNKAVGYVETESMGKIERGTDGEVAWEIVPPPGPGARMLEGDEAEDFKRSSVFNRWVNWRKLYTSAQCTGTEKVGEEECWRVVLKSDVLSDEAAYFSKASGLLLRWERKRKNPMTGEEGELATVYSDYKVVDGVKLAHKTAVSFPGGSQTLVWEKIEHNVELPKGCFAVPEAVRGASR